MSYSPDALKKLWGIVANKWDTSISYVAGAYVHYDGGFYKANKATTAGTWVASEWDSINIASQFGGGTVSGKLNSASAAQVFNPDTAYAVGDYVTYEDDLYQAKNAHPAGGAWVAADWTAKKVVNIFDEYAMSKALCDVYDATVSYNKDDLAMYKGNLYKANKTTTGSWIAADWDITNAKTEFGAVIDNKTVVADSEGKLSTSIGGYFENKTDTSNVTSVTDLGSSTGIGAVIDFSNTDKIKNVIRFINCSSVKATLAYADGSGTDVFTLNGPAQYYSYSTPSFEEGYEIFIDDYDKYIVYSITRDQFAIFDSTVSTSHIAIKAEGSSLEFNHFTEIKEAVPTNLSDSSTARILECYGDIDAASFEDFKTSKGSMIKFALNDGSGYFIKYLGETTYDDVYDRYEAIVIEENGTNFSFSINYTDNEWRLIGNYTSATPVIPVLKADGSKVSCYVITGKHYAKTDYIKIDNDTIVAELDDATDEVKTLHARNVIFESSYKHMPHGYRTTPGPLYYAENTYVDGDKKIWPIGFYVWVAGSLTAENDTNTTIYMLRPIAKVQVTVDSFDYGAVIPTEAIGHVFQSGYEFVRAYDDGGTVKVDNLYKFDDPTFEVQKALTALCSTLGLTMTVTYDVQGAAQYSFALNP